MFIERRQLILVGSVLLTLPVVQAYDIPGFTPDQVIEYKQTVNSSGGPVGLDLHVFTPKGHQPTDQRPAIVFFFGGGWNSGSPSQFHPHCEYLASRGMVAISAEYRVADVHGTTPLECVKDGKSAVRWIRQHAAELGIDPNKITAGGGSSGGHVAAATGTLTAFEEAGEDLAVSSKPNALVLFNPVYDNGPTGYGYSRVQAYWEDISPRHNINATTPPTVVFLGTSDSLIPVATAETYKALMEAEGLRCDLHLYEGQPHSFFNYDVPDDGKGPYDGYLNTTFRMDEFLVSLGYLADPHDAPVPVRDWVTIFGDAGFAGGSEATASPVTTDADADADGIAANITPVSLGDGEFVRLRGSVSFDAPLSGGDFRIGLFDGDDPVSPGDGAGYVGIWAEAPATADTNIAAGDGTGSSHPFETATASILGPVPAADATVPANTAIEFTLMIARNGNNLDISANFTDHASYHQSQNLLDQAVADYSYDSVAFLMTGNLNATQGSYSNIEIVSGPVLPVPEPGGGTGGGISRVITYVDASHGAAGNTFATGGSPADTSWVIDPGGTGADEDRWQTRTFGNDSTLLQVRHTLPDTMPELTTRLTGLADGTYDIWVFFWDQVTSETNDWTISAGLTSGSLTSYSNPVDAVSGTSTAGVVNAATLSFTTSVLVNEDDLRHLFGVNLGQATVSGRSVVDVHVDNLIGNSSNNRTWYDGVGYALVNDFSSWISDFGVGGQTGFDDDPDGDGNASGLENFFGSDPSVADNAGLSAGELSGNTFTFTHPQNATPADDLTAVYQWSINLDTFVDDGSSNGAGTTVIFAALPNTPTPGTTTMTATITGTVIPDRLFASLGVTQITP